MLEFWEAVSNLNEMLHLEAQCWSSSTAGSGRFLKTGLHLEGRHPTKSFCLLAILLELAVGCCQQPQKTLEKCVSRLKQLDHPSAKIDIFVKTDPKVRVFQTLMIP